MANRASFLITPEILAALLDLPPGTEIVYGEWDVWSGQLELVVAHPDLPETHAGQRLARVAPLYKTDEQGLGKFVSWGA
jgi:hypothetical protein